MNWRHTLAMFAALAAFTVAGVAACTDEPDAVLDLEVLASDNGDISLTTASVQNLEEWAASGGLSVTDAPTRIRVLGPDGEVLREVNGDSFSETLLEMASAAPSLEELERQADEVAKGLGDGTMSLADIDRTEAEEAMEAFRKLFEVLEKFEARERGGER